MSEDHIPIKNPTVDANDFKLGDFVYCISDVRPCYAVVIRISGIYVQFRHFENGFPDEDFRFLGQGSVRKASRDESLDHFHKISKRYEEGITLGGLPGAVSARRQHYIDGIISQLEGKEGDHPLIAATTDPPAPMTGTYVIRGVYSVQGPLEHFEGLVVVPRLSEGLVSQIMKESKPDGFGRIPPSIYDASATFRGSLIAYEAFEVPKNAVELVKDPKRLELR